MPRAQAETAQQQSQIAFLSAIKSMQFIHKALHHAVEHRGDRFKTRGQELIDAARNTRPSRLARPTT